MCQKKNGHQKETYMEGKGDNGHDRMLSRVHAAKGYDPVEDRT